MVRITGVSYCLPPCKLLNDELEDTFGKSAVAVNDLIGVKERRVDGSALEMGAYAAVNLIAQRAIHLSEIGLLIFVSESADYSIPSNACILQNVLGLRSSTMAFDISMGCSGYPYALSVAKALMEDRKIDNALVINADAITRFIGEDDRGLNCLHGDAAAATLLQRGDGPGARIGSITLGTDGRGAESIYLKNREGYNYVHMDGATVAHFVLKTVPKAIKDSVDAPIDLLLLHQANRNIVDSIYDALETPEWSRYHFLEKVGNLSNASTPVLFAEAWKDKSVAKSGHWCITSYGAGFSWGIVSLHWEGVPQNAVQGPTELEELKELYQLERSKWMFGN